MDLRILTVNTFGEVPEHNARVTLAPATITMVVAQDAEIQGRPVKKAIIFFVEGTTTKLHVSELDLLSIEQAVGSYCNDFS